MYRKDFNRPWVRSIGSILCLSVLEDLFDRTFVCSLIWLTKTFSGVYGHLMGANVCLYWRHDASWNLVLLVHYLLWIWCNWRRDGVCYNQYFDLHHDFSPFLLCPKDIKITVLAYSGFFQRMGRIFGDLHSRDRYDLRCVVGFRNCCRCSGLSRGLITSCLSHPAFNVSHDVYGGSGTSRSNLQPCGQFNRSKQCTTRKAYF